jgi:hypothetical protein
MKPSSDIDLFTTTLPFAVLVSLICCSEPPRPPFLHRLAWWRATGPASDVFRWGADGLHPG